MNQIKKVIYNLLREHVKSIITRNLGRVVEEEDKLICYVRKRNISKRNYQYNLYCNINSSARELIRPYRLDKPICYVLENIKFNRKVYISGAESSEIIIHNCQFPYGIFIRSEGNLVLDNTQITSLFYVNMTAKNITLKNSNIPDRHIYKEHKVSLWADDKLNLIDSTIGNQTSQTWIGASQELNLTNSQISGKTVECETTNLLSDNCSTIISPQEVTLTTKDLNKVTITAPKIVYNGQEFPHQEESLTFEKITDPLKIKRLQLIDILTQVKDKCETATQEEITKYTNSLHAQPLIKMLKK